MYKITIEHEEEEVKALKIKYFDTVPIAASLCILKSGFLFVASEFGNQCVVSFFARSSSLILAPCRQLYQFQKLGDDDDEKEFCSRDYPGYGMAQPNQPLPRAYFRPRPLENLALADELESLNPILDSKVLNLLPNSDTPQIFTLNGRGSRSVLRTLRHGLEVEETVSSDLPGIPNAVWTVKTRSDGEFPSNDDKHGTLTFHQRSTIPTLYSRSSTALSFYPSVKTLRKFKTLDSSLPRQLWPCNR